MIFLSQKLDPKKWIVVKVLKNLDDSINFERSHEYTKAMVNILYFMNFLETVIT